MLICQIIGTLIILTTDSVMIKDYFIDNVFLLKSI